MRMYVCMCVCITQIYWCAGESGCDDRCRGAGQVRPKQEVQVRAAQGQGQLPQGSGPLHQGGMSIKPRPPAQSVWEGMIM